MELNLQRQTITINETMFQGNVEQPIECDALLPDYCPDIVKVLKCGAVIHLDGTTVSADRLTIEGMAVAHIYYTSEQNRICHVEYKIPFGKAVELKSAPQDPVISVTPSVDYVNCRAVNQRRIDVRGAITFAVRVNDQKKSDFVSDAVGGGLQLKREMVQATEVQGRSQSAFPVVEELELGYGKSQIGTVLRSDGRVRLQDSKVIAGKVVAKGEMTLHILYQPLEEEGELEVMEYSLPLSQIIDCDAADEESLCDVELKVLRCDVTPKAGDDGEYRTFGLDARIGATVTAHRHQEIPVACDAYSTRYHSDCKLAPVTFRQLTDIVNETATHKVTLDLPEGIESVLDAWCEVDSMTWKQEKDSLLLDFKLNISLFARMENGECLYFEQQSEYSHTAPLSAGCLDLNFEPSYDVLSSSYTLAGKEKIDLRCEVMVRGSVTCAIRKQSISDITLDETREKQKEQNKLYIYYAEEGESVWDIAKHYNTSPGAVWEENGVEADLLSGRQMLLIPII